MVHHLHCLKAKATRNTADDHNLVQLAEQVTCAVPKKITREEIKTRLIPSDAYAGFYAQLVSGEGEVPWHATLIKWQGYVKF